MSENPSKFLVTATPHLRDKSTTASIMLDVIIALTPAVIMAIIYFGYRAALVIGISVLSCMVFEYIIQKLLKRNTTLKDLSAIITGILLALTLPAGIPLWIPVVGSLFAIGIVKQLFGGLGQNFLNPALAARAFLLAAYPAAMTDFSFGRPDAVTAATPITQGTAGASLNDIMAVLIQNMEGSLGEASVVMVLLGGMYLLVRRVINWRTPLFFVLAFFLSMWAMGPFGLNQPPIIDILLGGVMVGAFFFVTDYTTSPMTEKGKIIFSIGAGFITALIRIFGAFPEGVTYAVLLMNLLVPLIDQFTRPKVYGTSTKK